MTTANNNKKAGQWMCTRDKHFLLYILCACGSHRVNCKNFIANKPNNLQQKEIKKKWMKSKTSNKNIKSKQTKNRQKTKESNSPNTKDVSSFQ